MALFSRSRSRRSTTTESHYCEHSAGKQHEPVPSASQPEFAARPVYYDRRRPSAVLVQRLIYIRPEGLQGLQSPGQQCARKQKSPRRRAKHTSVDRQKLSQVTNSTRHTWHAPKFFSSIAARCVRELHHQTRFLNCPSIRRIVVLRDEWDLRISQLEAERLVEVRGRCNNRLCSIGIEHAFPESSPPCWSPCFGSSARLLLSAQFAFPKIYLPRSNRPHKI
jgi:hypothetical protein